MSAASLVSAAALALPVANAVAVAGAAHGGRDAKTVVVVNASVEGTVVDVRGGYGTWGALQVELSVRQVLDVTGHVKKLASVAITGVSWPVFPNRTPRSVFINRQALPLLQQETLELQLEAATRLAIISGASDTTTAWRSSLQAALVRADRPR